MAEPLPRRAPGGTISREDIVQAVTRMVMADGSGEVSVHALAADLGVAPVSLYRHLSGTDGVLDEAVDRLLARAWPPEASERDWRAWLAEAASRLRDFLVSQPAALHVYLRHPVASPAAIARMGAVIRVLRQAGLNESAARGAYGALHTYTVGFAALEASRAWQASGGEHAGDGILARQLAAYTTAEQFKEGLRYLLEGITSHASTSAEHSQQPEGRGHGGAGANAPGPGDLRPGLG
jgi:AcrR family transcriptional regulator